MPRPAISLAILFRRLCSPVDVLVVSGCAGRATSFFVSFTIGCMFTSLVERWGGWMAGCPLRHTDFPRSRQQSRSGHMTARLSSNVRLLFGPKSLQLSGEGLSYFALMLTFHPAASHLICGPLHAIVLPALLCWFVLRVRRRRWRGVLLDRFH